MKFLEPFPKIIRIKIYVSVFQTNNWPGSRSVCPGMAFFPRLPEYSARSVKHDLVIEIGRNCPLGYLEAKR